jgi:hypothetical protein
MSISGQNERWAQLAAYQPPSTKPGQSAGGYPASGTTAPASGSTGNAASGTSGALSDGMSLALMAFSGAWGTGPGTSSSKAPGQSGGTSDPSPSGVPATTPNASSVDSQLLTDVQSMIAALTGTPTGSPPPLNTQAVTSNPDTLASVSGTSQPGTSPSSSNDISNTGTVPPRYSDGLHQQFALSAYNSQSSLDSSTESSLAGISV